MPTKAELEKENASLTRKVGRLEQKLAEPAKVVTKQVIKEVIVNAPLEQPPSMSGMLYVESHPILGITRKATNISNSIGDGRIGDGATIVRETHA